jgi:hypothetical protein
MRLRSRQRHLVIWSSSTHPDSRYATSPHIPTALTGRVRRWLRIGMLVTVIVVRPRWKPLLAGVALSGFGLVEHSTIGAVAVIPGMMMLWAALLTPGDTEADHQRRRQLMRELSGYSTPAQRRDLQAALDQYPDGVAGEIRELLAGQVTPVVNNGLPGARRY